MKRTAEIQARVRRAAFVRRGAPWLGVAAALACNGGLDSDEQAFGTPTSSANGTADGTTTSGTGTTTTGLGGAGTTTIQGGVPDFDDETNVGAMDAAEDVPAGLTSNGDGTYSDSAGTVVRRDANGNLIDPQGNVVEVDPNTNRVVPVNPETEVESSFRVPVVTGRFVWSANPQSGKVALVDAVTLEVETMTGGLEPTYLAAVPDSSGQNRAIVINTGSSDATLFEETASGRRQRQMDVHADANAWAISSQGDWAVAWSDARQYGLLDDTEGLQDVTVIHLSADPPTSSRFSVGYRPLQFTINQAQTRAYAVTRDGISVIRLGESPELLEDVDLLTGEEEVSANAGTPALDDVPITSDGKFALVRFLNSARLKIIDLDENTSQTLELPSEVSDVDLAGDDQRAVAVIRGTSEVAVFDLVEAFADPDAVTLHSFGTETIGSAAIPETGGMALLFTNAIDSDRLSILDTSADDSDAEAQRTVSLKSPITAVFPTPDGSHAVALLKTQGTSTRQGAFSVVPVTDALPPKIQGTDAPPFAVSLSDTAAGLRGLVTVRQDPTRIFATYLIRMPSLQVDRIALSSPPIAAGILPDEGVGYVAQEHPEGRITFIDLESGSSRTLTGFELAEKVIDGSE